MAKRASPHNGWRWKLYHAERDGRCDYNEPGSQPGRTRTFAAYFESFRRARDRREQSTSKQCLLGSVGKTAAQLRPRKYVTFLSITSISFCPIFFVLSTVPLFKGPLFSLLVIGDLPNFTYTVHNVSCKLKNSPFLL